MHRVDMSLHKYFHLLDPHTPKMDLVQDILESFHELNHLFKKVLVEFCFNIILYRKSAEYSPSIHTSQF